MTTYSMTGPDGKTYSIDGPAGATQDQVAQQMASAHANLSAPSPGFGGTLADMARSVPGGLAQGVAGLAGLPGDIRDLAATGLGKVAGWAGADPQSAQATAKAIIGNSIPFVGSPDRKSVV